MQYVFLVYGIQSLSGSSIELFAACSTWDKAKSALDDFYHKQRDLEYYGIEGAETEVEGIRYDDVLFKDGKYNDEDYVEVHVRKITIDEKEAQIL